MFLHNISARDRVMYSNKISILLAPHQAEWWHPTKVSGKETCILGSHTKDGLVLSNPVVIVFCTYHHYLHLYVPGSMDNVHEDANVFPELSFNEGVYHM